MRVSTGSFAKALLPLGGALALAACGGAADDDQTTYEAGATDEGGGDLIVNEADPSAAPVDLPDTPMTPVPSDSASPTAGETPEG